MENTGVHEIKLDPQTGRWVVIFNGVKTRPYTFATQVLAERYLEELKLTVSRRGKKGRPSKNRVVPYEPTQQWAVYVNNKFVCFKPTESEAWSHMNELAVQQIR